MENQLFEAYERGFQKGIEYANSQRKEKPEVKIVVKRIGANGKRKYKRHISLEALAIIRREATKKNWETRRAKANANVPYVAKLNNEAPAGIPAWKTVS